MKSNQLQIARVSSLLVFLFLCFAIANAQICDRLLKDGKDAYDKKDFQKAKEYFQQGLNNRDCADYRDEFQRWKGICDIEIKRRSQGSGSVTTTVNTITTLLLVSTQLSFDPLEEEQQFEKRQMFGKFQQKTIDFAILMEKQ